MHSLCCISLWLESALDKQFGKDKVELHSVGTEQPHPPSAPSKKPLPALRSLGPMPAKPPRPPLVDLSCHNLPAVHGLLTCYNVLLLLDFYLCNFHIFDFCVPHLCLQPKHYNKFFNLTISYCVLSFLRSTLYYIRYLWLG